jgi:hypothetical protein
MENLNFKKLYLYQLTVLFSVIFSMLGFSYNVWRMEVTEENSNIRTACFEILLELSSLEQLIYAAHYDGDVIEGSPRKGWVKVGLIADLSVLTTHSVESKSANLKRTWTDHWHTMSKDRDSVDNIVTSIDLTRLEIKQVLSSLE